MSREAARVFRSAVGVKRYIRRTGKRTVVLANGCFDPLHVGHVRYLYGASEYGDFLVVAINDDKSTRALKGPRRPVMPAGDRARLVAQLEMVDAVLIFSAADVRRVLKTLLPRFHAKGTDYTKDTVPERELCRDIGIETVIVGDPKAHASRDIVGKIKNTQKGSEVSTE
ncbi:MAG: adenylyltransferase/cytidyltransferase family protein [Candidatus Krumholzibacteria bacterium]